MSRPSSEARPEPGRPGAGPGMEAEGLLDRPCAVIESSARGARGRTMVVGWTSDGLPAAVVGSSGLSRAAREAVEGYQRSGLPPRRVPFTSLVPVSYALTGPAVDFADTTDRRAEDQVRYTVTDARGERREIDLGERAVLGAIAAARVPWQAVGHETMAAPATEAVPLYTVFVPRSGLAPDAGLALLFEPTIAGGTNEPAFRSFVRNTVGRLLVLDESQGARSRKGYLDVAGRLAGTPPGGGSAGILRWLRRAGLVDFDDGWLQRLQLGKRRAEGQIVRLLRATGMVEVDDEVMHDLLHPRPDYDIDPLDMDSLMSLAEQMYEVARKTLA